MEQGAHRYRGTGSGPSRGVTPEGRGHVTGRGGRCLQAEAWPWRWALCPWCREGTRWPPHELLGRVPAAGGSHNISDDSMALPLSSVSH